MIVYISPKVKLQLPKLSLFCFLGVRPALMASILTCAKIPASEVLNNIIYLQVNYAYDLKIIKNKIHMKRIFLLLLSAIIMFGACAKPEYKTRSGKKKLRYYNSVPHQMP